MPEGLDGVFCTTMLFSVAWSSLVVGADHGEVYSVSGPRSSATLLCSSMNSAVKNLISIESAKLVVVQWERKQVVALLNMDGQMIRFKTKSIVKHCLLHKQKLVVITEIGPSDLEYIDLRFASHGVFAMAKNAASDFPVLKEVGLICWRLF